MPQKLTETIKLTRDTRLDVALLLKILIEVQARLDPLELLKDGLEAAIKTYSDFVLSRVDLILGPASEEITEKLATLTGLLETAEAALAAGTEGALAAIQPQIDAALADVVSALDLAATATSAANAAAAAANAAAAGITTQIDDAKNYGRRMAIRFAAAQ